MVELSSETKAWYRLYPDWVPHVLPMPTTSMADVLEEAAKKSPDAPAIQYFDRVVTYGELDDLADRFATVLAGWNIGKGDRVALFMQNVPQYLIALYGMWKRGAVVVPLNPMFKEKEAKYQLVEKWKPTMTVGSITVFLALMNHPGAKPELLKSITKAFSGGAPIAPSIADAFEKKFGIYIHNIYGLTESNSPTHAVPLGGRAPVDPASGALSVGIPIPGCDVRLVDMEDPTKDVPAGEAGEIADRGPMIFTGYWNKPEATAAAFDKGYFLTGDIATRTPEGYFFVVDRKKDMINVSGYKVWPREVEDTLYTHVAVKEAAVIGIPDEYRGETVKAFVSLKAGMTATPEDIIEHCKKVMAAYKYPRFVEIVDEIPKTVTGKFLRRVLRDRDKEREAAKS